MKLSRALHFQHSLKGDFDRNGLARNFCNSLLWMDYGKHHINPYNLFVLSLVTVFRRMCTRQVSVHGIVNSKGAFCESTLAVIRSSKLVKGPSISKVRQLNHCDISNHIAHSVELPDMVALRWKCQYQDRPLARSTASAY